MIYLLEKFIFTEAGDQGGYRFSGLINTYGNRLRSQCATISFEFMNTNFLHMLHLLQCLSSLVYLVLTDRESPDQPYSVRAYPLLRIS